MSQLSPRTHAEHQRGGSASGAAALVRGYENGTIAFGEAQTVTVQLHDPEEALGLEFAAANDGTIVMTGITHGSPLHRCRAPLGLVVSIAGMPIGGGGRGLQQVVARTRHMYQTRPFSIKIKPAPAQATSRTATIRLMRRSGERLGMTLDTECGVSRVDPESPAARAGVVPGMKIHRCNGHVVREMGDMSAIASQATTNDFTLEVTFGAGDGPPPPLIYSGWLKKLGGSLGMSNQTRWFEIRGHSLFYYKERPPTVADSSSKMLAELASGAVDLTKVEEITDDVFKPTQFTLRGARLAHAYTLTAESLSLKDEWLRFIRRGMAGGSAASPQHSPSASPTGSARGYRSAPAIESKITQCGWLKKLGGSGLTTRFQNRWCELRGSTLWYYKETPKGDPSDPRVVDQAAGSIDFAMVDSVREYPEKQFGFVVEGSRLAHDFTFAAESEDQKDSWTRVLRIALKRQPAGAASAAPAPALKEWECPRCTLVNSMQRTQCGACEAPRPANPRAPNRNASPPSSPRRRDDAAASPAASGPKVGSSVSLSVAGEKRYSAKQRGDNWLRPGEVGKVVSTGQEGGRSTVTAKCPRGSDMVYWADEITERSCPPDPPAPSAAAPSSRPPPLDANVLSFTKDAGGKLGTVWEGSSPRLKSVRADGVVGAAGGERFVGRTVTHVNDTPVSVADDIGRLALPASSVRFRFAPAGEEAPLLNLDLSQRGDRQREEAERREREEADRKRREEADRRAREEADRKEREEADRRQREREEADRRAREEADRRAREEADRREREEADRRAREEADRRAREEADRREREEADRRAREEADRRAREEADRREREEADRRAREEADRRAREEADRREREEAERRRRDREEAERREREETERREREDAERRRRDREDAERREREEADRREMEESERRRREKEEAERREMEEADRRRRDREEAERREREESDRREREEAERRRREREDAERRDRDEADRIAREREEADRKAREEADRRDREDAERRAAEEERREREDAERRSRDEAARLERERRDREESERRAREDADRARRREEEEADRRREDERRMREEDERREAARRDSEEAERARREREDADRRAREEDERKRRREREETDWRREEARRREAELERSQRDEERAFRVRRIVADMEYTEEVESRRREAVEWDQSAGRRQIAAGHADALDGMERAIRERRRLRELDDAYRREPIGASPKAGRGQRVFELDWAAEQARIRERDWERDRQIAADMAWSGEGDDDPLLAVPACALASAVEESATRLELACDEASERAAIRAAAHGRPPPAPPPAPEPEPEWVRNASVPLLSVLVLEVTLRIEAGCDEEQQRRRLYSFCRQHRAATASVQSPARALRRPLLAY